MEIIDVTFRESVMAQRHFDINDVFETIERLSHTTIDYIEVGYFKNMQSDYPLECYSPDYISTCHNLCNGRVKLAAMIHPEDFRPDLYSDAVIENIALLRITSKPENLDMTGDIISYLDNIGIKTSINLLRASNYTDEETLEYCKIAEDFGAHYFYVADSNGNMIPHEVRRRISTLKQSSNIKIGFHAHNNLGMALINSLAALKGGADILDSSLLGFGKGAGNLKTEMLPVVLARLGRKVDIDKFHAFFRAAQFLYHKVTRPNPIEELYRFALYGLFNIEVDFDEMLQSISEHSGTPDYSQLFQYISEAGEDREKVLSRIRTHNGDPVPAGQ